MKDYLTASVTARKYNIDNSPTSQTIVSNLEKLDKYIIVPLLTKYPNIKITQVYRSLPLTKKMIEIGDQASKTSKHMKGLAVDFIPQGYEVSEVLNYLKTLPTGYTYYSNRGHIHTELKTSIISTLSTLLLILGGIICLIMLIR